MAISTAAKPTLKATIKQQTEADPLHRYRAQEHDQSRGTRHDAAADAEGDELLAQDILGPS